MIRLLFIDDDPTAHKTLKMILPDDYTVLSAYTGEQGLLMFKNQEPDIILLDINLPDKDGIRILEEIKSIPLSPPVIMLTAFSDISLVVKAVQKGAYDYIAKPYNFKQLEGTIRQAAQNLKDFQPLDTMANHNALNKIIGESSVIKKIKTLILKFATSLSPVLIMGKSGTGKELVAQAIHNTSPHAENSFIAINCGAIPNNLIESELFGSEKGAFTDAKTRPGSFEKAHKGTIFLDEIGEMPLDAQVKLLRILEEKQVTRIGGIKPIPINVRVISATNRNLKQMIKTKEFREDLYYRIGVLPLELPLLTEHKEDIPLLAVYFIKQVVKKQKILLPEAREKLINYSWPGNVRELRNVIERALIYADGKEINAKDIIF